MRLILVVSAFLFTACASEPMTPEQAAYYRNMGNALTGLSQQMNYNSRPAPQSCWYRWDDSLPGYVQTCY